jgi:hypothetical protein
MPAAVRARSNAKEIVSQIVTIRAIGSWVAGAN